jgi:hypothetical protein
MENFTLTYRQADNLGDIENCFCCPHGTEVLSKFYLDRENINKISKQ